MTLNLCQWSSVHLCTTKGIWIQARRAPLIAVNSGTNPIVNLKTLSRASSDIDWRSISNLGIQIPSRWKNRRPCFKNPGEPSLMLSVRYGAILACFAFRKLSVALYMSSAFAQFAQIRDQQLNVVLTHEDILLYLCRHRNLTWECHVAFAAADRYRIPDAA